MPKLHLKQSRSTYSACGSFTKYHEIIQKFRQTGNLKHLYRNKFEKAGFAHDAANYYGKNLATRTTWYNTLKDIAYETTRNRGYNGHQRALASTLYKFFDEKKKSGTIATSKMGVSINEQLDQKLNKPVTKKFKK